MIAGHQKIVSITMGYLPIAEMFLRQKDKFACYEWDEETYFWVHGEGSAIQKRESDLIRVGIRKPEDPSAFWLTADNSSLTCSPDQELLSFDGKWVRAGSLKVGDTLQHFCGNGHCALVTAVDAAPRADAYDMKPIHFGTYVVSGLILKGRAA